MSGADETLRKLAAEHGIYLKFSDLHGVNHVATPDTLRALLRALNVEAETEAQARDALAETRSASKESPSELVILAGQEHRIAAPAGAWVLETEQGRVVAEGFCEDVIILPGLEVGYYQLSCQCQRGSSKMFLMARPSRAPCVPQDRCWGATGALYGLRSDQNGGLGSYPELGSVSQIFGHVGAQFFGVNPVHAIGWGAEEMISPYSPSHRGVFNTDHIQTKSSLGKTPDQELIDYVAFRTRQRAALIDDYENFKASGDQSAFDHWCKSCPGEVKAFATFEAISEQYGSDFRNWPSELSRPGLAADAASGERASFHLWLQWLAHTQLDAAQRQAKASGMSLGLYLDLAVGPRVDGAEVWMNAETIAKGVTIGAPPDDLSPAGQSWALAAHAPGPLAKNQYAPLRSMLHNLMVRCGLLRIDHALGLLRSFWIPDDGSPGGYIAQPLESLLAVITIEAHCTGCAVVGEDLGLVPSGLRSAMKTSGIYSYSVWQFETNDLNEVRSATTMSRDSLACFGTHDTPTMKGYWYGNDIELWHSVGWSSKQERDIRHGHRAKQRASLRSHTGLQPSAPTTKIVDALHGSLAASPAAMVSVQLDDIFGVPDAQNLPGTIDEHPNWRRRLPTEIKQMARSDAIAETAAILNRSRGAAMSERCDQTHSNASPLGQ